MPIERLSFPAGKSVDVTEKADPEAVILGLISSHASDVTRLEPGEYDLTPAALAHSVHSHILTVHENGEASYRILPNEPGACTVHIDRDQQPQEKLGGGFTAIPQADNLIGIADPVSESIMRVFEVIKHVAE